MFGENVWERQAQFFSGCILLVRGSECLWGGMWMGRDVGEKFLTRLKRSDGLRGELKWKLN